MIPQVNDCYFYSRENSIIYANLIHGEKIPLIRLHQKFIDIHILSKQGLNYMQKYLSISPNLWEAIIIEPEQTPNQLILF